MSTPSEPNVDQLSAPQRLLLALKHARIKLEEAERQKTEPIAIIGMGCRFPGGASEPTAFWRLLHDGVDAITEVPVERWDLDAYYDPDPDAPGKMYTRYGGFIGEVDQFDPQFFGISPREAASLDPQQRLLLEVSWEALEYAGRAPEQLHGSPTGVFIGLSTDDYSQLSFNAGDPTLVDPYSKLGNGRSFAAGRVAYVLDLHGPTMQLDTTCSSSLLAVHLACQSLRTGECNLALAGGVQLMLQPADMIGFCRLKALAPDGRCKTFDAAANGYARGEGCGIVVLKRLSDALADDDNILALIRGSAVNHDGRSNGLTAPNGSAQEAVIRQTLKNAKVKPAHIQFVEAHGTGTPLGDPIEMLALGKVLGEGRPEDERLIVGSVKTNFGHLEAAAGAAGLIKVVLALQHGEIPPHLHFKQPNPHIAWEALPVRVPTALTPWPAYGGRRRAGVSASGMSGTNVHVIVEEAPRPEPVTREVERAWQVLTLSAKTGEALTQLAERYAQHLAAEPTVVWGDVCFTANTGRSHFGHRLSVVAASAAQASEQLRAYAAGQGMGGMRSGSVQKKRSPKVAWLFTGQGAQYAGMGRELYETQPVFRQALGQCAESVGPYVERPLLEVLYPAAGEASPLDETAYTQPALFALEYALAQLWRSWGIEPAIVMGHSVGEYVAACVAGVFGVEEGLRLVARRGRLMQELPRDGAMVAVWAGEAQVRAALAPYAAEVGVAAVNGPEAVVVSGRRAAVEAVVTGLEGAGVRTQPLRVSHAFHSPLMEPMLGAYAEEVRRVTLRAPQVPLITNVTGGVAKAEVTTPAYWCEQVRQPVQFAASMVTLGQQGVEVAVEVGPQPTLIGLGRRCLPGAEIEWVASMRRGCAEWQQLLESVGALYVRGVAVDWAGVERGYRRRRVVLPTYPFQRQRYCLEPSLPKPPVTLAAAKKASNAGHPLLDKRTQSPLLKETIFESQFTTNDLPFLSDHRIHGIVVVPSACHISMLLGAMELTFGAGKGLLEDLVFPQVLALSEAEAVTVQVVIVPESETEATFKLISFGTQVGKSHCSWNVHATGQILTGQEGTLARKAAEPVAVEALRTRAGEAMSGVEFYEALQRHHVQLGPNFQSIGALWKGEREVLCQLQLHATLDKEEEYQLHPIILDACFQALSCVMPVASEETFIPFGIERFWFVQRPTSPRLWCHATLRQEATKEGKLIGDVRLFDQAGQVIAVLEGLKYERASRAAVQRGLARGSQEWLYTLSWQPAAAPSSPQAAAIAGRWLICGDATVGAALTARLAAQGAQCVQVVPGASYARLTAEQYQVNPIAGDDWQRLLRESQGPTDERYRGVLYLWGLEAVASAEGDLAGLGRAQELGCGGVLHLVQALAEAGQTPGVQLWVVTRGAQAVGAGASVTAPAQAPLWGLGRVLALEHTELGCVRVDLDPAEGTSAAEGLWAELGATDGEDQVGWRQGHRYVARLVRAAMGAEEGQRARVVREDGSYLISGGLGALGLRVAQWLVGQGARHLVLMGRRGASPQAQVVIEQLEAAGCRVRVVQADVTQPAAVAEVLEQVRATLPPVRGIVHAAGVVEDGVLLGQSWERFSRVLAPKVAGGWTLHRLTQDLAVDFFINFSSVAALVGSPGQGSYAAANAFLDALAHYRRAQGRPGLSINWGPWAELGMAASLAAPQQRRLTEAWGFTPIAPEQGLQVLDEVLRQDVAQVAVMPMRWASFVRQLPQKRKFPFLEAFTSEPASEESQAQQFALRLRLEGASGDERRALLMDHLSSQLAEVLGLSPHEHIEPRQRLFDLGLDSLMAVELKSRLEGSLGCSLPATLVFDYPMVEALVNYLIQRVFALETAERAEADVPRDAEMEALLTEVDQMSESEVERRFLGDSFQN